MRPLANIAVALRLGLVALAPVVVLATPAEVAADAKSEARTHYQAGVKFYSQGDYKSAIREFSAAQQKYPADLNNYNLALCYDKLGDPEPAIQYYKAFLDKQPNSDKRAEIEASVTRLEAAQARVAAKREAEAKKAEAARKAAEEKKAAEEAKAAEAAAKKAAAEQKKLDEQRAREEAKRPPVVEEPKPPVDTRRPDETPPAVGSTGTPGSGAAVSTGDAQLDRVSSIDVNSIRDQRVGGAASGVADPRGGPGGAATPPTDAARAGQAPPAGTPDPADKPKAKPVYTKWWFWVIVGVGAYVLYQVASEPDDPSTTARTLDLRLPMPSGPAAPSGGFTLMRW